MLITRALTCPRPRRTFNSCRSLVEHLQDSAGAIVDGWAEFKVLVERGEPHLVRLVGELDMSGATRVFERLAELDGDIDVDCSGLAFIDASGLRSLLAAHQICDARGNKLVVVAPSRQVRHLLDLTSLDAVLFQRSDGSEP
jgi:anti-anti-sigma factor